MPPAARVGDSTVGPTPEHPTGVILPPAASTVTTTGQARARVTDKVQCACGSTDYIVTGSPAVLVRGLPAARVGSMTLHGTAVVRGDLKVDVGGPSVGATFGNFAATGAAFHAMAAGRNPPPGTLDAQGNQVPPQTAQQSYNNCGVEASRQLLHAATGSSVSQEALLRQAMDNGWAYRDPHSLCNSGGSWATGRAQLLTANGVPSSAVPANMEQLKQAVADGRGVSADVWAAKIWPPSVVATMGQGINSNSLPHAIVVTGMKFDGSGNLETVYINDTGMGTENQPIPAAQFAGALLGPGSGSTHLVTDRPVW